MKQPRSGLLTAIGVGLLFSLCLQAADPIPPPTTPNQVITGLNTTRGYVRVKASPDECYKGLGLNSPYQFINQLNPAHPCAAGQPKVDQGYVWGSNVFNDEIWFGTTANGQCVTQGGVTPDPSSLTPYQTAAWACEFGEGPYSPSPIPGQIGDFRPPRLYVYNTTTHTVTDITAKAPQTQTNILGVEPLMLQTRGLRSITSFYNTNTGKTYMLVAGPALSSTGAVNYFAYDQATKQCVAKFSLAGYDNQRRWQKDSSGIIYAPVGKAQNTGGAVLRYAGNFNVVPPPLNGSNGSYIPLCPACFTFQKVGDLDGEAAYATLHQGRMYIATWPQPGEAGLYMSPTIPATGLTTADAGNWTKVWTASDYEPDPVIVGGYATGALQSFGGYLYWGTMNVPFASNGKWFETYGDTIQTNDQAITALTNSWRNISIFRGQNLDTTPQIDLLYGYEKLPEFFPDAGGGQWEYVPNHMPAGKQTPLYGQGGFGNNYNAYTWGMAVWNNKLYLGTFDWSYMAVQGGNLFEGTPIPDLTQYIPVSDLGGDLWVFADTSHAAVAESLTGLGNYTNYGVRVLMPIDSDTMYIGAANPMNLLTNLTDNIPEGGWELIELKPKSRTITR